MDKYSVKLMSQALRDLDQIYLYISQQLLEPETASKLVAQIEDGILSLESMPYRCSERKTGAYADKGYRIFYSGALDRLNRLIAAVPGYIGRKE